MKNTLIKVLFHFFSLSYEIDYTGETAVRFFFQKCYQIISAIFTSFLATNGFLKEKLATFSVFSLVKLHPFATKKRRIEYKYPDPKPDLNGHKPD